MRYIEHRTEDGWYTYERVDDVTDPVLDKELQEESDRQMMKAFYNKVYTNDIIVLKRGI